MVGHIYVITVGHFSLIVYTVRTTMIYTHVLNRGGLGVRSPVDTL